MDPGTAFGAVSLVFQVFAGCIKGYQLLSEARGLEKSHQFFRIRFKTEQYRLLDWAGIVQLSENDETLTVSRASRPILLDVLDQQCRLILRFGRLDDRLRPLNKPLLSEEHDEASGTDWDAETLADSVQSRFPSTNGLLQKSLDFMHTTSRFPARLRWAISDKAKIEDILTKLTGLNDYLDQLLNNQQMQQLNNQQVRTNYQIMQLNNKMDHLCELVRAGLLPIASKMDFAHSRIAASPSSFTTADPPERNAEAALAKLAQVKALISAIDSGPLTSDFREQLRLEPSQAKPQSMKLSAKDIELIDKIGAEGEQRTSAWYKPSFQSWRKVWIEWKGLPSSSHGGRQAPDPIMLKRFEALVGLLREEKYTQQFRTLRCLGYYAHQGEREIQYGFVYENLEGVDPSIKPRSLIDYVADTQSRIPSLSARISLMRVLAESVERLHAVNWLHKGLRSQNILFFPSYSGSYDLAQPYLSGFDYSRPESADYMSESPPARASEDLYRHPAVQGGPREDARGFGYKKQHDIYALGVVLLEIAYWKPIYAIMGFSSAQVVRPREAAAVKERLLDGDCGFYVRSHMGDAVADVIMSCLAGPVAFGVADGTGSKEADSGAKFQERFFDVVVKRLQQLRI